MPCDMVMIAIAALRTYQITMLLLIVIFAWKERKFQKKVDSWNRLSLAKWVFYFCAFASGFLCFGVVAELQELQVGVPDMWESVALIAFFLAFILICGYIVVLQQIWQIKFNDNELIFRNFIGKIYRYPIGSVSIITKNRMKQLYIGKKKITQWDELLIDAKEELLFERTVQTKR